MITAVGVSIGVAMCQINFIVVMLKHDLESQRVVRSAALLLKVVLVITYVVSISMPLVVFRRIEKRLHPLIVRAVRLNQVNDVELIDNVLPSVPNVEVEPLGIVRCPIVILKDQIVFMVTDLNSSTQVSRFKSTLED